MQRWNWIALVFAIIGIITSTYLVVHHYNLIYGLSDTKSFCTVSAKIDCDAVNTSSYSTILGVPVAMVQAFVLFVSILLLLGLRAFGESEKAAMARFLLYLSTLNLFGALTMGIISTLVLKTFCLMCGSLYLVAAILWIAALKLNPKGIKSFIFKDLKGLLKGTSEGGTRGFLVLFLVIPIGSVLASGMYEKSILSSTDFGKMIEQSIEDWKDAKHVNFEIKSGGQGGTPGATFNIVEFFDYQCPHCKRASPSLHAFVNSHRDQVHISYQNYPLDSSCNPRGGNHELACALARASMCALEQNKFSEAHDWIFDHQDTLSSESVGQMAGELGLNKEAFEKCIASTETNDKLRQQIDLANNVNIEATPTIYVNGRQLSGGFLIPVLEAAFKNSK